MLDKPTITDGRCRRLLTTVMVLAGAFVAFATNMSAQVYPLKILSPNGGEVLKPGNVVTIFWRDSSSTSALNAFRLEYSSDDGATWSLIADLVKGTSYKWTVPYLSSTRCRIRATQVRGIRGEGDSLSIMNTPDKSGYGLLRFNPDGSLLMASRNTRVDVYRTETGELVHTFQFPDPSRGEPIFDPSGTKIAFPVYDRAVGALDSMHIEIRDAVSGDLQLRINNRWNPVYILFPHWIEGLVFSPDGRQIMSLGRQLSMIWDAATGDSLFTFPQEGMYNGGYSEDGNIFFTQGLDTLRIWDAQTRTVKYNGPFVGSRGRLTADGRYFIGGKSAKTDTLVMREVGSWHIAKSWVGNQSGMSWALSRDGDYMMYSKAGTALAILEYLPTYDLTGQILSTQGAIKGMDFHPDGERLAVSTTSGLITLWKFERADMSDTSFTIQSTHPLLPAVVFDSTRVNASKEKVVAAYIQNSGAAPLAIERITFTAGDSSDFSVVSGGGPVSVPPGGSHAVTLRFVPHSAGLRTAWLAVNTTTDTLIGELRGVGVQGQLEFPVTGIDFGNVYLGNYVDTTATFVRNVGNVPISIDTIQRMRDDSASFSIETKVDLPVELAPGESLALRIRFAPKYPDLQVGGFYIKDEYGDGWQFRLTGSGQVSTGVPENHAVVAGESVMSAIIPNPSSTAFTFTFRNATPVNVQADLISLAGEIVARKNFGMLGDGEHHLQFDVSTLSSGHYLLIVDDGRKRLSRSVIIER